jgi:DNA polymerase-3 subunit beta
MRIECTRDRLAKAIQQVERVTSKNVTLPVLKCILLETKDSSLIIKATNLDIGIEVTIPVKIQEEGTVAVPGATFSALLQNMEQEKNVILETKDQVLLVTGEHGAASLKTVPHEDFPGIPRVTPDNTFTMVSEDFLRGLKSVWYSSATTSMKPELSSVYLYAEDESLVFVATDSFRLAEKKVKNKKAKDIPDILIPFKGIPEVTRVLENIAGEVTVVVDKTQISFEGEGIYLVSRVVDGHFPDYRQIIPQGNKTKVTFLKADIISALKLANIFSDQFHQVGIGVNSGEKSLEIKTKNNDIGEARKKIPATVVGEDVAVNFNYKYIMDCFQSIGSDSVSFEFNGLNRPLVIKGASDQSFTYLVMPMNR